MLNFLNFARLRAFALLTVLAVKDAIEHPVGQLILYAWLLSVLPLSYWPILLAVCLGITVVHELAHWAVARWLGFSIETFSLGLPFSKTSYRLLQVAQTRVQITPYWLFGGYVSFDPTAADVLKAPAWKRALVLAAGPAMNLLLAVLLFAASYQLSGKEIYHDETAVVYQLNPGDTPARKAGILPGDLLKAVDGAAIASSAELNTALAARHSNELKLTVERQGTELQIGLDLAPGSPLGFSLGRYETLPATPRESLLAAVKQSCALLGEMRDALLSVLHFNSAAPNVQDNGSAEPGINGVHSIVAFVKVGASAFNQGIANFLYMLAVISLNLAVLNILPLPLLDGGHLLFIGLEVLRGKAVAVETQTRLSTLFLLIFAGLFVLGLYNDYFHPIV